MLKIFFISLTLFWQNLVIANITINITSGMNTECPIAIIPFTRLNYNQSNSLLSNTMNNLTSMEDISSIIKSDLKNSGQFNIISTEYLPHQPTNISDIIPMFWEKIGINIMVLGTINVNYDGHYVISYQLIDTSSNPALIILENQYLTTPKHLRYTAHTISNEIFEKLTGIKGVFCTRIAYILRKNHVKYPYELCISDYDGYNQSSICQSTEPLMSPAWSADGKKIAYVTFASGHAELVIQTLDTGCIYHIINFPKHNGAPAFSPDGKKLAFVLSKTGSLNLYIMDLKSKKIQKLTNNSNNNTEPSWFPDNKSIAYTSDQGGTPQIYKIDLNTLNIYRLSWKSTHNHYPNVSSDGKFIIMINRHENAQNILKLDLFTGKEEILTNTFLSDTPCIAPNDTMILYSTINKKQYQSTLELISINGHITAHVEGIEGDVKFPTWSPLFLQ